MKLQIASVKEDIQKARKEALRKIVKAYKLSWVYFVVKARTQWDMVISEMHGKDPWVAVNGTSHKGPCMKTWTSFWTASNSTSSLSSLVMQRSCSATTCNKVLRRLHAFQCIPSWCEWAFSMTTWLIYLRSGTVQWLLKTRRKVMYHSTRPI